jgi:hypothetical protein
MTYLLSCPNSRLVWRLEKWHLYDGILPGAGNANEPRGKGKRAKGQPRRPRLARIEKRASSPTVSLPAATREEVRKSMARRGESMFWTRIRLFPVRSVEKYSRTESR